MITTITIFYVLISHFISDWVFQSRKVGEGKSKSFKILLWHVFLYGCGLLSTFLIFSTFVSIPQICIIWIIKNTFLHLIVDFITSKFTSYFYKNNKMKAFWTTIGADQLIHYLCLFFTI